MTRRTRDGNKQRRTGSRLRVSAERRLSRKPSPQRTNSGETGQTTPCAAHTRGGSVGAAQRCAGAGAEMPHVRGGLSGDRRRFGYIALHGGASADCPGVAVLERAGAAGRAHDSAVHDTVQDSPSRQRGNRSERTQKYAAFCRTYRRSLICYFAYSIAQGGGRVYKQEHR